MAMSQYHRLVFMVKEIMCMYVCGYVSVYECIENDMQAHICIHIHIASKTIRCSFKDVSF